MDKRDLDQLEILARAATPGPWEADTRSLDCSYLEGPERSYSECYFTNANDAKFIAAANPEAILQLIELARRSIPQGDEPVEQRKLSEKITGNIGPQDFGIPREFADRARNYADFIAARAAAQGDDLPPLPEARIREICRDLRTKAAEREEPVTEMDIARAVEKEVGAACRAGRAKGEDARDALGREMAAWLFGLSKSGLPFDSWRERCAELSSKWDRLFGAAATAPEGKWGKHDAPAN